MTDELPIACSLSARDLTGRLDEIAQLGRGALLEADLHGPRATLRFAAVPGVMERLTSIVAAESECCAFLTMTVHEEHGSSVLGIAAPGDAELVLEELVDAFRRDGVAAR